MTVVLPRLSTTEENINRKTIRNEFEVTLRLRVKGPKKRQVTNTDLYRVASVEIDLVFPNIFVSDQLLEPLYMQNVEVQKLSISKGQVLSYPYVPCLSFHVTTR